MKNPTSLRARFRELRIASSPTRRRSATLGVAVVGAVALLSAAPMPAEDEAVDVDGARALVQKYVETRRLISREKSEWALGKELLLDRIGIVEREIESLRAKIEEADAQIVDADAKRAEMVAENDRLKAATVEYERAAAELEGKTRRLLPRLPPPLLERLSPLSQRLPADSEETDALLTDRYANVLGILDAVDKWNRDVTLTSEVRDLGEGTLAEVKALYVGIGAAFYTTADGTAAGSGSSSEDGWSWTRLDEAAPAIARAIAILNNEQMAGFVQLPIVIQ